MSVIDAIRIVGPLDEGTFRVRELQGSEGLSEPFCFTLQLTADKDADIDFSQVVGQAATIVIDPEANRSEALGSRYIHGIVTSLDDLGADDVFAYYEMEIRPPLWLLSKRINCRVFQQMTVPQIIEEVLNGSNAVIRLHETYYAHNYCVQYRESDLDFLSRIMEEEGIYYFFTHDETSCYLNIADSSTVSLDLPENSMVAYDRTAKGTRSDERIHSWRFRQQIGSTAYRVWDHSFEMPDSNLEATAAASSSVVAGAGQYRLDIGSSQNLEIFDYPGAFAQRFDGVSSEGGDDSATLQSVYQQNAQTAKIRMQEESANCLRASGASNVRRLCPGYLFQLTNHAKAAGSYLIRRVVHSAKQSASRSDSSDAQAYENSFECLPAALAYRPPRRTTTPTILGTQSATVVGPTGEEIFTDKYGRVKIQFRWDRYGDNTESSSCWVRVAKPAAGSSSGFVAIPRIGQEVIVAFLEGDPDAPIIVGSVHNADTATIFDLPTEKKRTSLKTTSYQGSSSEYSGFVIDDTSGSEHFQLRSQNNMTSDVMNDHYMQIGSDHYVSVGGSKTEAVGSNHTQYVPSTKKVAVGYSGSIASSDAPWSFSSDTGSGSGGDATLGEYTTIVLGIDSTIVAGVCDQIVVPLRINIDVGVRAACCTAVSMDYVLGYRYDWVTGTRSDYTWGTHSIGASTSMTVSTGTSFELDATTSIVLAATTSIELYATTTVEIYAETTMTLGSTSDMTLAANGTMQISAIGADSNGVVITGSDQSTYMSIMQVNEEGFALGVDSYTADTSSWSFTGIPSLVIGPSMVALQFSDTCFIALSASALVIKLSDSCFIMMSDDKITIGSASMVQTIEGELEQKVGSLNVETGSSSSDSTSSASANLDTTVKELTLDDIVLPQSVNYLMAKAWGNLPPGFSGL